MKLKKLLAAAAVTAAAAAVLLGVFSLRGPRTFLFADVLHRADGNGYYAAQGHIGRLDETLSTEAVSDAAARLDWVYESCFQKNGSQAYYAVVPDKNYWLAAENGYPACDYGELFRLFAAGLDGDIREIRLRDALELADYYRTDPHWSQTEIVPAAERLLDAMGAENPLTGEDCGETELYPFYGGFWEPSRLTAEADTLKYLTCPNLKSLTVYDYETGSGMPVYDTDSGKAASYDLFLGGAKAILEIKNPNCGNGRQLVLFRDSFGSSIAPLLARGYEDVLVIDLRYVQAKALSSYVSFKPGCDVLFLYSTSVLNSFGAFK